VEVTVLAVDGERKRISLSMKKTPGEKAADQKAAAPSSPGPVKHKIEPGKSPQKPEKKKTREAPKKENSENSTRKFRGHNT
jgi:hypothetical protein